MEENIPTLVLIGDGYVGKTSIFDAVQKKFTSDNQPTVYNKFDFEKTVDSETIKLRLMDTAGQEEFDQLRKQYYGQAKIFLICFCVTDKTSYENILSKWIKDIEEYRSVPKILIGTKTDLRSSTKNDIGKAKGIRLQKKIGALEYIECSALKRDGIDEIIISSIHILNNKENKKSCILQ